jgi:DNA-binding transcriptional LysR family regulator
MEIGRPAVMARLVEAGLGVSVLPETAGAGPAREGALHYFDRRKFSVVRELGLLLLRGRDLEPATRAFIRVLEETSDTLP